MANYSGFMSYNSDVGPVKNKVPVIKQNASLQVVDSPVEIDQVTGATSGINLDFEVVSTNTYTITTADTGKAKLFTFAGTVTVTIPDATATEILNVELFAASGTTVNLSKATGGDTLLGATSLASTESARLVLRSNTTVYEVDPLYQTAGPGAGDVVGPGSSTALAIATFSDTSGKIIQNNQYTTIAAIGSVLTSNAVVGSPIIMGVTNSDNTNGASDAHLRATVGGTSGGDPHSLYIVTGGSTWTTGVDNSDSDSYVIAASATLGTSNAMRIATTGAVNFYNNVSVAGNVIAAASAAAATISAQVTNSDNTSGSSNAQLQLAVGGTSSGDPSILWQVSGAASASWYMGLDNSASDALIIGEGEAVGTTPALTIAHTTLSVTSGAALTAGTTLTATLGDITATNGNLVLSTAGNKLSIATGANASVGTATLVGGTVTVNTTAVTASSIILLTRQSIGATGAAALGELTVGTIVAGTSFVVNAVQAADATALQASDVSVIGYQIIN